MSRYYAFLALASGFTLSARAAQAQPGFKDIRLNTLSPELVVDTAARNAACDVVAFTPDGKYLMAVGDDKAVRVWPFSPTTGLDGDQMKSLRWSSFREQRGSIYALAMNRTGEKVAITGYGLRPGATAVLDRKGEVLFGVVGKLVPPSGTMKVPSSMWSVALSPSEKQVVMGGEDGSVWAWDLDGKSPIRRLGLHPGLERQGKPSPTNFVRFVAYVEGEVISVAADGWVCEWNPAKSDAAPQKRFRFDREVGTLVTVVMDSRKQWLAAGGQDTQTGTVEVVSLDGRRKKMLHLPAQGNARPFPRCLAFDPAGAKLAVGYYTQARGSSFYHVVGGGVTIFDLSREGAAPVAGPSLAYYPESLGFHPNGHHLAVAVAANYEVEVYDLERSNRLVSRVTGPGRSLWGVGLAKDGKMLVGFQSRRNPSPGNPNDLGTGEWQVFNLERQKVADPRTVAAFAPTEPIEQQRGWKVVPDAANPYLWHAVSSDGKRQLLKLHASDDLPRCYTFLPGAPTRVVIGHYWGMSVFELGGDEPKLLRKFVGHQGEVTAVAPSRDGKLLVSASRDQTVCIWRVANWPNQDELGASFEVEGEKLVVKAVATGSPAWEAGLVVGDGITKFDYGGAPVAGGPAGWLRILQHPTPGRPCEFDIPRQGNVRFRTLTTARQRPVLRLYPMQNHEWVLWRYHDFYYNTSTNGDSHIGWLHSRDVAQAPKFDRAEQYREKFHNPEKIDDTIKELFKGRLVPPERIEMQNLEAPMVAIRRINGTGPVADGNTVEVEVSVEPSGPESTLAISGARLWVNDRQFEEWPQSGTSGKFTKTVRIASKDLRRGQNLLTIQGFNGIKARRDSAIEIEVQRTERKPHLHAVLIGIGAYPRESRLSKLTANRDAQGFVELWNEQKLKQYGEVYITSLVDGQATRSAILDAIKAHRARIGPDDVFLLYLGGHGTSDRDKSMEESPEQIPDNTFIYCAFDFQRRQPVTTGLKSNQLYQAIRDLPGRKLILLDTCHSGSAGTDPVRSLTPHAMGPLIFSACAAHEKALELTEEAGRASGLFALAVHAAAGTDFSRADANGDQIIEADELGRFVIAKVVARSKAINLSDKEFNVQNPQVFLPVREKHIPLFRKN